MTGVTVNGKQIKQFIFDAANRMSFSAEVTDDFIKKAEYRYNGLGQRIGQNIWKAEKESTDIEGALINIPMPEMPEEKVNYTLDPTRTYYNMLCLEAGNKWQNFYWDGNVISMEEGGSESYYVHDDLGSPACLLDEAGYRREVYGYDEFGADLFQKSGDSFCRQVQPFGFTGYQMEEAGGVYYAQARRYDAELGRFISEDFIKGFTTAPYTLNHYGYCWNRPLNMVDLDGLWAEELETAGKAVTMVIAGAALVATIVTGGAVVALGIAAGAVITGVISGYVNEENGGSYINGWAGGVVSGGLQTVIGAGNPGRFMLGGIANGAGSFVTDILDNIDPTNDKYKTKEEIYRDTKINASKGVLYSVPGAFMGWAVDYANANSAIVEELMPGYDKNLGEGLNQFFGVIDNLLLGGG